LKKTTIGITGHRDMVVTEEIKEKLINFFTTLKEQNQEIELLSPLADGADRLVADIYLDIFQDRANLIVPMPFNQERYMQDFDIHSKEEFLKYLNIAKSVFQVDKKDECNYKSVGIYVADNSNLLIALWDGGYNQKSGGTGDIVSYAKEKDIDIFHILVERKAL